jgi:transcriptional regulator with XRE-family HTH domain
MALAFSHLRMRRKRHDVDAVKLKSLVGERIIAIRRKRHWTQEQLAEEMGVSVRYVQRIESGQENLTLRTLARLAEVFDIRVAEIFE